MFLTDPKSLTCRLHARLPPITQRRDGSTPTNAFLNRGFAFQAPAWQRCQLRQVLLTKVFRQSSQRFIGILNEIRHASRTDTRERGQLHGAGHEAHIPSAIRKLHVRKATNLESESAPCLPLEIKKLSDMAAIRVVGTLNPNIMGFLCAAGRAMVRRPRGSWRPRAGARWRCSMASSPRSCSRATQRWMR